MARHSFIQMSKLPNVKGRISYITSHARQENLYATYHTADNEFWSSLARESQQEFKRSGTEGKCIEARELIIALPEVYTRYEPQEVLEDFTEEFRRRYGVGCVSALHHNKRKTNYHIHLIFSERKLLPEPDIKIATRSVFYDEAGKRVRTKKEITGEDGQIRKGCTVIKKGEVYETHLFTVKDDKFKSEPFLREVKEIYTDLINRHILKQTVDTAENKCDFIFYRHRMVLRLNEKTLVFATFVDHTRSDGVDITTELGKRFQLAELSLINFESTGDFLH